MTLSSAWIPMPVFVQNRVDDGRSAELAEAGTGGAGMLASHRSIRGLLRLYFSIHVSGGNSDFTSDEVTGALGLRVSLTNL